MPEAQIAKRADLLDNLVMRKSKHKPNRHVLNPDKFEIACVIVHVSVAEPYRRCIAFVMNDRIRNIHAFPTGELGSKTQVNVFIIQKKIIIQKTNLVDHLAAVKSTCRASGKNRLQGAIAIALGLMAAIEAHARSRHPIPDAIDAISTFYNELRSANPDPRVVQHWRNQVLQPSRIRPGIVVHKGDKLPVRRLQPFGITSGKTGVARKLNHRNFRKPLPNKSNRPVRGAVVNHDNLAPLITLTKQVREALFEYSCPVPVDNDNADWVLVHLLETR